jgi:hypothetical protein
VDFADYFSTDKMFYSNKSNDWLDAPNAALFGLRGNKPQNNTVESLALHTIHRDDSRFTKEHPTGIP